MGMEGRGEKKRLTFYEFSPPRHPDGRLVHPHDGGIRWQRGEKECTYPLRREDEGGREEDEGGREEDEGGREEDEGGRTRRKEGGRGRKGGRWWLGRGSSADSANLNPTLT